jgi:hypothetical protein
MTSRVTAVVLAASVSLVAGGGIREAGACSCVGPQSALLTPDRVDDAPLNTRVRVELASSKGGGRLVLRAVGSSADIPTAARTMTPGGWLEIVELVPQKPLAPDTRHLVALVDRAQHPTTTVIGTFKTGTSTDTSAPRIDAFGTATAHRNAGLVGGGSCSVPGPWVTIDTIRADDPGRRDAQIVFGVWLGDASGRVDATKPPTTILRSYDGGLNIGQMSLCDPRSFPLPSSRFAWLGIAALDEAGNASALRKVHVELRGTAQP